MSYTVILFVTRKPTISPQDFQNHWEHAHIPLLQNLTGPLFPKVFRRQYLARIDREGFGGPANRDRPPLVLRGSPEDFDFDAVAEMIWEDEKTFQEYYKTIHQSEAAAKLARDEEHFLDTRKMKMVVVGQVTSTRR